MVWSIRARTAETPKQPRPDLRLRAPYFYPDRALASLSLARSEGHQCASEVSWLEQRLDSEARTRSTVATLTRKTLALWTLLLANAVVARPVGAEPVPGDSLAYDRVTELGGVSLNLDATYLYATIEPCVHSAPFRNRCRDFFCHSMRRAGAA